jgi:hypothetical protein
VPDDPSALTEALAAPPTVEITVEEETPPPSFARNEESGIVRITSTPPASLHVAPRLVDPERWSAAPRLSNGPRSSDIPTERAPRGVRPVLARSLFVLLFGAVTSLLGYALRAEIRGAAHDAKARLHGFVGVR